MTPLELATYVRWRTKTDSNTFPDAILKTLIGIHMDELATRIIQVNQDYFGMPYTTDLVAGQREYPLPSDKLATIKMVEASFDGENWITLKNLDLNNYRRTTNESTILENFANDQDRAYYDLFRGSLWLYSGTIIDVDAGLKLWSFSFPSHVTDLSSTVDMSVDPDSTGHGFPREFHRLLADMIVIEYKESGEKPIALTEREQLVEDRIQKRLDSISNPDLSKIVTGEIPNYDYANYANDGYDF